MRWMSGLLATTVLLPASVLAEEIEILDPIIVRAQHRDQDVKNVPVTVEVFDQNEIKDRSVQRIEDVFKAISNVNLLSERGGFDASKISVRGISSTAFGAEPAIGFYVDDVYMGSDASYNTPLFDMEQVELLKGPQGTLYGRNSLSGAINLRSKRPELGEGITTTIGVEYGSNNALGTRLVVNAGIDDNTAFRLSAQGNWSEGWVKNTNDSKKLKNKDDRSVRAQFLHQTAGDLEILLSADYGEDTSRPFAYGEFNKVYKEGVNHALPYSAEIKGYGGKVHATYDFGMSELQSILAYRTTDGFGRGGDLTPSPLKFTDFQRRYQQVTHENRLTSKDSEKLDWTLGTFLLAAHDKRMEKTGINTALPAGALGAGMPFIPAGFAERTNAKVRSYSAAVFGDATWHVTDKFEAFAGARIGYDKRSLSYDHASTQAGFSIFAPAQLAKRNQSNWDISPRLGVAYDVTDDIRTYASVSKGYKAGGFNIAFAQGTDLSYDPETAWNYEVGIKGSALDDHVSFSASAFYFDWRNQQIYAFQGRNFTIHNAPKSRSKGVEASLTLRPIDGLELTGDIGYQDAEFVKLDNFKPGISVSGNRLPFSSKMTAHGSVSYTMAVTDDIDATIRADYNWRSPFYWDPENKLKEKAHGILNARFTLEGDDWTAYAFGRNILDKAHQWNGIVQGAGIRGIPGEGQNFGVGFTRTF
ncbi:MAG: TonB-dependent receptor [Cohaesibacter sp.]|nr:TonB-dependent receptor [Cohaesibacter sp.]